MKKRKWGNSGIELSVIGLGTWAMGGGGWKFGWGPQDDGESVATIRRALEQGVNWIDTAPLYGFGHAETVVGRAMKELRERPFIATKFGLSWDDRRKVAHCLRRQSIRSELEGSLRRLKVDRIDLYQLHWPAPDEDIEEAWSEVAALSAEGKIRYAGACNCSAQQLERLRPILPPVSLQAPYNLFERAVEKELLPYCCRQGIGVIGYGPLYKGFLSGGIDRTRLAALPMDDHRKRMDAFRDPALSVHLAFVRQLRAIAEKTGRTPAQLAIAWALRKEDVTAVIAGARTPAQAAENAGAADHPLTAEELQFIDSLLAEC